VKKYRVLKAGIGSDVISASKVEMTDGVLSLWTGSNGDYELVKAYGVGMWVNIEPVDDFEPS
jgi:hypothetical protein